MIAFPAGVRVWIAGGVTDMRRGMNTLALAVQQGLGRDPHAGEIFCFRGRRGDLVKLIWHDGTEDSGSYTLKGTEMPESWKNFIQEIERFTGNVRGRLF